MCVSDVSRDFRVCGETVYIVFIFTITGINR